MNKVTSKELFVEVAEGSLYLKKWTPEIIEHTSPIVLMHDSLGSVDLWRNFPEQLASSLSCEVIAYDRLGFGRSSANKNKPSVNFVWDEADLYFSHIKKAAQIDTTFFLFGHSVGGGMSIGIAAVDKDCIGVITESAQAFVEDLTIKGIEEAQVIFQQPEQFKRLEKWHKDKTSWVLSAWIDTWLSTEFSNWSLMPRINNVTCPTLALHGDRDEYGSRAFPEYIAKNVAGKSSMVIIDDCGHVPHKEKTEEIINHVKLFISHY